jgi:DNA repair exonuclease SbcCD ATPase subunit
MSTEHQIEYVTVTKSWFDGNQHGIAALESELSGYTAYIESLRERLGNWERDCERLENENVSLRAELHEWEESDTAKVVLESAFAEQIATLEARNQLLTEALEKHYKPIMARIAASLGRAITECPIDGPCARCRAAGAVLDDIEAALLASKKAGMEAAIQSGKVK